VPSCTPQILSEMVVLYHRERYNVWADKHRETRVYWPIGFSVKLPIRFVVDYDPKKFQILKLLAWTEQTHQLIFAASTNTPFSFDLEQYKDDEEGKKYLPREFVEYRELVRKYYNTRSVLPKPLPQYENSLADAMENPEIDIKKVFVVARLKEMMKGTRKTFVQVSDIRDICNERFVQTLQDLRDEGIIVWNEQLNGITFAWAAEQHEKFKNSEIVEYTHDANAPPFTLSRLQKDTPMVKCDFGRAVDAMIDKKMIASTMVHPWCIKVKPIPYNIRKVAFECDLPFDELKTRVCLNVSWFGTTHIFPGNVNYTFAVKLRSHLRPHFSRGDVVNMRQEMGGTYEFSKERIVNGIKITDTARTRESFAYEQTIPAACCAANYLLALRDDSFQHVIIFEDDMHSRWIRECVRIAGGPENVTWVTRNAAPPKDTTQKKSSAITKKIYSKRPKLLS